MTQPDIRRPVVAGAGTMGTTLARIFAQHGFAVTLWNRRTPSLERAQTRIAGDLDRLAAQGLLTEDPAAIARRVTYTTDYAAFDGADFVVENIAEDLAVKQAFFRAISPRVAPEALLTTNTSGLRVTDVAQGVEDPTRFCGMHWWNPPDLMPLVEITRGDQTSQAAAQAVHALALALGKKPVIVQKDILGILGNRLQYAVMREALHILATGAAGPEEIDAAMKYGPGFRYAVLGPFETADLGGRGHLPGGERLPLPRPQQRPAQPGPPRSGGPGPPGGEGRGRLLPLRPRPGGGRPPAAGRPLPAALGPLEKPMNTQNGAHSHGRGRRFLSSTASGPRAG